MLSSASMKRPMASALLVAGAISAVAAACSQGAGTPAGSGDRVIVDVDATNQPQQPQGGSDASPSSDAYGDSRYTPPPDGYAPYNVCSQCACPSGSYCFGGGTGYTSSSAVCGEAAAPPPDGGLQVGCVSIPAQCANANPICPCLLKALSNLPCYTVCTDTPSLIAYCPNP